jgi:hypothetical protein
MACGETISESIIVGAIDFGTTFSGYAFAIRNDYKVDPMRVSGNHWQTGSQPGLSLKTPSCILFDPTQKFHSFGGDAEDKYAELAQEDEHIDWFYFKRFKMQLYDKHVSLKFPPINFLIKQIIFNLPMLRKQGFIVYGVSTQISTIFQLSWRSVLLVEETGEKFRPPVVSHRKQRHSMLILSNPLVKVYNSILHI